MLRSSGECRPESSGPGKGGEGVLFLDGKEVGRALFEKTMPGRFSIDTFDVGCDLISPVSEAYESPFRFTGTIKRVLVDISDLEFHDLAALVKVAMAIQ